MSIPSHIERLRAGIEQRTLRTFQDFAEREIRLPSGPKRGLRYRCDFMPFTVDLFAEFDRGNYTDFFCSGPGQGGKTLNTIVIPAAFHLFDVVEDIILGAPVMEMAKATWRDRILPAIEQTRFREFLPRSGGGSKGGVPDYIRLLNGGGVRFMGAGGGDAQRSSYTARVILATEIDKMDDAGDASDETDPITQLKTRSKAFGRNARFYAECTMSTKQGRIYREVVQLGTDSRVMLPCRYCGRWVWPERAGIVGWQEAADEIEAAAAARFQCPEKSCAALWTEEDRQAALRQPRIVARGQTVRADGVIEGDAPRTKSFGFRWNAMSSPLTTIGELAVREWRAQYSTNDDQEKAILQFDWAEPWEDKLDDLTKLELDMVVQKTTNWPRGVVPPETLQLTLGVDVGSYVIWFVLMAWFRGGAGHIVDWDGITVPNPDGKKNPSHILAALRDFRDKRIKPGWKCGDRLRQPDKIIADSGYEQDVVFKWVRESGEPRYLACKGFGSNKNLKWSLPTAQPSTERKVVTQNWKMVRMPAGVRLIEVHADHWKARIHDGLAAAPGAAGSISVPAPAVLPATKDKELKFLARQLCAEQRISEGKGGHEAKIVWNQVHVQNHWLDCASYACCGADIQGVRLVLPTGVPPAPRPARVARATDAQLDPSRLHRIRSKY